MARWSQKKAWDWYNSQGWIRGCNFIGSDCANRIDQWQSYGSEERMAVADRELQLAHDIGFNSVRLIVDFEVWLQEPQSYMQILEQYISLCAKHEQSVMIVLATEAQLPRGDGEFVPKPLGEQKYALGYHQGRLPLSEEIAKLKPYHFMERPELAKKYIKMVKDIVKTYANDDRVLCWNVYNEPGITIRERSIPILDALFAAVRSQKPKQPCTADIWRGLTDDGNIRTAEEQHALELSDVISFHSYKPYHNMIPQIESMRKFGRPLFCTEWLNRINHSNVQEIYPLFYLEKIACYCWGFVVGKTQTHEPWDVLWKEYYDPSKNVSYDFTKWQHDLFRPNLRPYDPNEIELIKRYNKLACRRDSEKE